MDICNICNRLIDPDSSWCSDFCAQTADEEKVAYKTLQVGDWGFYPCSECGITMDDVYPGPTVLCSRCEPRVKLRKSKELLEECSLALEAIDSIWGEEPKLVLLRDKIKEFLKD